MSLPSKEPQLMRSVREPNFSQLNAAFPTWHRCSFLLTIVNIICIIVTGIIILKVKQVTSDKIPQRNHSFWKQDIKVHK